jgi:hypothetical protein
MCIEQQHTESTKMHDTQDRIHVKTTGLGILGHGGKMLTPMQEVEEETLFETSAS